MDDSQLGPAQRRIIDLLKRSGSCTTTALAEALGVTTQAVRPPLADLEDRGLVVAETITTGERGRPPLGWALLPRAIELFPDRHRDLTLQLMDSLRSVLGEDALADVLLERARRQKVAIEAQIPEGSDVASRVEVLARVRCEQGYMAEITTDDDSLLLTEHHCPVCAAATSCQGMCANELDLFEDIIGPDGSVERVRHLLSGDERCVYRIRVSQQAP